MNKRDNQFKREMYVSSNKNVIVGIDIRSRFHYFQYQISDMRSKAFKINNNEQGFQIRNYTLLVESKLDT